MELKVKNIEMQNYMYIIKIVTKTCFQIYTGQKNINKYINY